MVHQPGEQLDRQDQRHRRVTNYAGPAIDNPQGITAGPDGALWFTNEANNSIGRITTTGIITDYVIKGSNNPRAITVGSDGAIWFSGFSVIGRITTGGATTIYSDYPDTYDIQDITSGPDGALWFTNGFTTTDNPGSIGRITTSGEVSTYKGSSIEGPEGITSGPDGTLWFAGAYNDSIGRITTTGSVSSYSGNIEGPAGIITGPDGALWYTNYPTTRSSDHDGRSHHQLFRSEHRRSGLDHDGVRRGAVVRQ